MINTKSAIIFLIFSAFLLQHVSAADKTALLIANSDYGEHPLPEAKANVGKLAKVCLLYTSPSPRDLSTSRMPSSA